MILFYIYVVYLCLFCFYLFLMFSRAVWCLVCIWLYLFFVSFGWPLSGACVILVPSLRQPGLGSSPVGKRHEKGTAVRFCIRQNVLAQFTTYIYTIYHNIQYYNVLSYNILYTWLYIYQNDSTICIVWAHQFSTLYMSAHACGCTCIISYYIYNVYMYMYMLRSKQRRCHRTLLLYLDLLVFRFCRLPCRVLGGWVVVGGTLPCTQPGKNWVITLFIHVRNWRPLCCIMRLQRHPRHHYQRL